MSKEINTYCEFRALTQKIAEFKKKNYLTYQQMADAIGVDKSHVHRVVNMDTSPSLKFLLRVARYMKLPVFSLFIPTENIIAKDTAAHIQLAMEDRKIDLGKLEEETGIPPLRLMDITKGNTVPTPEEFATLADALELDENQWINTYEVKLNLLQNIISDLGLNEDQITNIMEYIDNISQK